MKRIRKKEYNYFHIFLECSEMALESAKCLHRILVDFTPTMVAHNVEMMHKLENNADDKKHEMLERLAHEFMTPIEREDIVSIAQQLDHVVDAIEDVMQRIYMFDITRIRPDSLRMAEFVVKGCEALVGVMREFIQFKKSKTILKHIIEVNAIESDGDKVYIDCMRKLFAEESNMHEIVVWKTMYECLEKCLDACEHAADSIESVIMKNM